jgi:hypothetical protein
MKTKWCSNRVSAWRRELNSHEAAQPQLPAPAQQASIQNQVFGRTLMISKDIEHPKHIEPSHCEPGSQAQSVRWAAAASLAGHVSCRGRRHLENVAHHGLQRGAGCACGEQPVAAVLGQVHQHCEQGSALPNPSLKLSTNGRPPGPGRRYAVHFRQPGPGALPLAPA